MKRILTFVAVAILLCTTAFADLNICNTKLTLSDLSYPASGSGQGRSTRPPANRQDPGGYGNASYTFTGYTNKTVSGTMQAFGSDADSSQHSARVWEAWGDCAISATPAVNRVGYFSLPDGTRTLSGNPVPLNKNTIDNYVLLSNVTLAGGITTSFSLPYWNIQSIQTPDVRGVTLRGTITGFCTTQFSDSSVVVNAINLQVDTLNCGVFYLSSSVSGAANLQRVTQCVAKQSGDAGFQFNCN